MAYFVTGATGFIGRHLVEELLRNRTGDVYVFVRETSRDRLDALIGTWPDAERVHPVVGDLGRAATSASTTRGSPSTGARSTTSSTSRRSTT